MADYRVLVTGSRNWADYDRLSLELGVAIGESCWPLTGVVIVHGACPKGADTMADEIARSYGYRTEPHPADWDAYGRRAGFIRNAEMAALGASICLAFIRNGSAGASHCAALAEKAGIPTRRFTDG